MVTNQAFSTIIKFVEDSGGGDVPGGGGGGAGADSWVSSNAVASSATSDALMVPLMILLAALVVVGAVVLLSRKKAVAGNTTGGYFANNLIGGKHFTKIIVAIIAIAMACFIALPVGTAVADNDVKADVSTNITAKVNKDTGVVTFENGYLQNKGDDRAVGIETFKAEGAGQGTDLTFAVKTNTSTVYSGTIDGAAHVCDGSSFALKSSTTPLYYTLEGDASATKALIGQELTLSTEVSNMSELSGITKDNEGNPLSGVAVKFTQDDPAREYKSTSGTDGAFSVQVFAGCTGTMTFTKEGETFDDVEFDKAPLKTDDNTDLGDISALKMDPGCYFINSDANGDEYVTWEDACDMSKRYWQKYSYGPGSSTNDVKMPTLTYITDNCFSGNNALRRFIIPEGVVSSEEYSLKGCQSLEEVYIPSSLEPVGSAFEDCYNLKKVTIADNAKIETSAFSNCVSLKKIYFLGTIENFKKLNPDFIFALRGTLVKEITCTDGVIPVDTCNVTYYSEINSPILKSVTCKPGDVIQCYQPDPSLFEHGTFVGWQYYYNGNWYPWDFNNKVMSNLILLPILQPIDVKVTFLNQFGGELESKWVPVGSTIAEENIPEVPLKEEFTSNGWKHQEDNSAFDHTVPIKNDMKLYPSYTQVAVDVYNCEGEEPISSKIAWGSTISAPTPQPREGYEFAGWGYKIEQLNDAGASWDFNTPIYYDIKIIGYWYKEKVTVTYKSQGEEYATQEYDYGDTIVPPQDPPIPSWLENYKFLWWYFEQGDNSKKLEEDIKVTSDLTLYAEFGPLKPTVYFYLDSSMGTLVKSEEIESGGTVEAPEVTKSGCVFRYWKDWDANKAWDKTSPIYTSLFLCGEWANETLTVKFCDSLDEQELMPEQPIAYGNKIVNPGTPTVTHEGMEFYAWGLRNNSVPGYLYFWNFDNKITEDVTLYAIWKDTTTGELIIPGVNDAKYKSSSGSASSGTAGSEAAGNEAAAPSEQAAPAEEATSGSTTGDSESAAEESTLAESDEPQEAAVE